MDKQTSTTLETGYLPDKINNRYWQIKLKKDILPVKNQVIGSVFNFIKVVLGIIVFSVLLLFISIISSIISFFVKNKAVVTGTESEEVKTALQNHEKFMDVYATRVYSPVMKPLELGLSESYVIDSPSLEIAVGDGYLSSLLFSSRKDKLTIGSDMIYETILSAEKYNHIDRLAIFDAEQIPLPDNCLNTVIMYNLMHHLPSRNKVIKEVERVLRPGGKFIFTDNLSGWVKYTFDSRLLRFLKLNFFAEKLEAFKLNLFAQKLLTSAKYWETAIAGTQMEIVENREFMSRRAMTISSIFEYFNLLQGQPTRRPMKMLLKINPLKKFLDKKFDNIIRYLILNDQKLLKDAAGAFLFVVLRKKSPEKDMGITYNDIKYVCPDCKNNLILENDSLVCNHCSKKYILKKNIPVLLPYHNELKNFNEYLNLCDTKKISEFKT